MRNSSSKPIILIAVLATVIFVTHLTSSSPLPRTYRQHVSQVSSINIDEELLSQSQHLTHEPRCRNLPGAEDVLVIMRTGSTEIKDKLPIHLNTTFRCFPDTLIFSDYAENFQGYEIHDALARIPEDIKSTNDDFELYRRIREYGRGVLDQSELSGSASPDSGAIGKLENKGWKLDKWKFLPMMADVMEKRPDKKFYVFVEPDTYLMWSNLLQWLANIDPSNARYFGSETLIGEDLFAHGGSAFVMTKPALMKGVSAYLDRTEYWDEATDWHWAGDCMVGKVLADAGVELTYSWPMFQGGNPAHLNWADSKGPFKLWCTPALSYHHLTPHEVEGLWRFEQSWASDHLVARSQEPLIPKRLDGVIRHRDVFRQHILSNIRPRESQWNNNSPNPIRGTEGATESDCRAMCAEHEGCVQYALKGSGCWTGTRFEGGQQDEDVQSGWMMDRVDTWIDELDVCEHTDWVTW